MEVSLRDREAAALELGFDGEYDRVVASADCTAKGTFRRKRTRLFAFAASLSSQGLRYRREPGGIEHGARITRVG